MVESGGAGWAYADDELEALTPTQKQLLRMGRRTSMRCSWAARERVNNERAGSRRDLNESSRTRWR